MGRNKILIATATISILSIAIILLILHQRNLLSIQVNESIKHSQRKLQLERKSFRTEAVIAGIGDILIHDWVYNDAKTQNGYDFKPMFAPVKTILQKPDFLIANQESIPGGSGIGISNYPRFNSPHEIVDALIDAGVDMVTTANNHALDKGENGILSALNYYEEKGLMNAGTYRSKSDQASIRIAIVNGIRIAVLPYASHTNGLPIPKGKDYLVNLLDRNQVLADINEAKKQADLIILALHWGEEYERKPNETQKKLASEFIHAGADIIFGHHPHVLQPIERIRRADGQVGVVIYSLGNFLSGQLRNYKDIGGMVEITVEKEVGYEKSLTMITDVKFHPTFTASTHFRQYMIHPLENANQQGLTDQRNEEIIQFMFRQ